MSEARVSIVTASAGTLNLGELSALMTAGFAGYVVPVTHPTDALAARIRAEQVDLHLSRIALVDGVAVGVALLAVRGRRVRVAAMGVIEGLRGRGVGRALLDSSFAAARDAGAARVLLEVIAENVAAVELYRRAGFVETRRLVGYQRDALPPAADARHRESELEELAAALAADPDVAWSWQMAPASVAALASTVFQVHALGDEAYACIRETPAGLTLRQLTVRPSARRRGLARSLLAAIQAQHPGASWELPPLVPEAVGHEALGALGFARMSLHQLELERDLAAR
ncbi:MAG: GNAT family N-acetyltransferase [Kofleriaceae bacterium]